MSSTSLRDFFLNDEPKESITSPSDYPYLIIMRHLLSVISSWPLKLLDPLDKVSTQRRMVWVTIQRSFHMVICLFCVISGLTYVILHKKSMTFFELGHVYISLLMTLVIFSRITTLCFNPEYVVVARKFLEKIHLFFYKDRSEYSMKTHKQVHRISHWITLLLVSQMLGGLSLFNVIPIYNNYAAGNYARGGLKGNATYQHALYFSYPFNVSTNLYGYVLANFLHWFFSYLTATWFCMHDCFLSLMVFHLWGHFKILLYNLDHFPRPSSKTSFMIENSTATITSEMYSQKELADVSVQLGKLIEYHRDVIRFFSYLTATWFCMHDCFLSLMVFHLWGHFKILLYNLDHFPRPSSKTSFMIENSTATITSEMYSQKELADVSVQLGKLIEYHRDVISFTDKMSEVFGPMLLVYYGFHQTTGCLLLLECSQMTAVALVRYLPLTIILFQQLIQLSIIFELIGSVSGRLKDAVYGLPWECMDTKNRKTVAFFLMNVQEPVHVKALGLADVGVTSMATILKTSISYFTFLKSL